MMLRNLNRGVQSLNPLFNTYFFIWHVSRLVPVAVMGPLHKILLSVALLTIIVSGLSLPVSAGNGIAKIVVEPRIIDISVSSTFTIDIWIRDLSSDFMQEFDFTITWDPALMEYVSHMDHVLANDPN